MPLEQRVIQPIYISQDTLPVQNAGHVTSYVSNDLECVANG